VSRIVPPDGASGDQSGSPSASSSSHEPQLPSLDAAHVIRFTLSVHAQRDPVIALREAMGSCPTHRSWSQGR